MFNLFRQKKDNEVPDIKMIRQKLLQFIKEQLQLREGGEGRYIRSLQLFLAPGEDKDLYQAAVYAEEEGRFQNEEVQKIADDYAIDLPHDWNMELIFSENLPAEAVKAKDLPLALHIVTNRKPTINKPTKAVITILNGEAEQKEYHISATGGKVCIGRDRQSQTSSGFFRTNNIAFPGNSQDGSNKYISRQHAHIEWNRDAGCFFLYADEGGVPPRNKVKVRTGHGELIKLQTSEVGHPLGEGDQIILGETALLLFNYQVGSEA